MVNLFFFGCVVYGYLFVLWVVGLFVDFELGFVFVNYGLENLCFFMLVLLGDSICVEFIVK